MKLPVRFTLSSLFLVLAACGGPDSLADSTPELDVQPQAVVTTRTCTTSEPKVEVSSEGASVTPGNYEPCELLDNNWDDFAIIGGSPGPVTATFTFATKQKLTGFRTQLGGYDDHPSEYLVSLNAGCDEGHQNPFAGLYSGKQSAISFDSPCTTSAVTVTVTRQDGLGYGVEHITELRPVYWTSGSPSSGDRMTEYSAPQCTTPEKLQAADILAASNGALMGRIQLWRSRCSRVNPNTGLTTQVYYYYARSLSLVGVPSNMDFMSVFLRYTNTAGQSGRLHLTTLTRWQSPTGGDLSSNLWGAFAGTDVVTVAACGRYYANEVVTTSEATAAGCTAYLPVQ